MLFVFEKESHIPERSEQLQIEGTKLDIFFCSEDQPILLGAFAKLFSETRRIQESGIVQINLWGKGNKPLWQIIQQPDERTLDIIKRVYFQRKRLTNTPVRRAWSVLKCPDDRKNRVVSAQATYPCGSSAVGGRVCEQRYAAERVLPESRFELQHSGSPSKETALEEKA